MSIAELVAQLDRSYADGLEFEPNLTVSEWADAHRMLSSKASAEPGRWRTARTPYLREIMDSLSALNAIRRVVFMKGAQVGATECGNNWIGYVIHHAPAPFLMVQPTVDMAGRVSRQRIAPMIEASEVLAERVSPPRSRDAGNSTYIKEFVGGLLILTGANTGAGLRSMPIRDLFCDEVDGYPGDVEGEGDPVSLAEKRTTTFARRKIFLTSTPTVKGLSRIESEFKASDQRFFYVPCPHCGNMDWIRWANIRWEPKKPETAKLFCEACEGLIEERFKTDMLNAGVWKPTAVGDGRTRGYHLSGLYSPLGWKSWQECVEEFLDSKDDPFRLKTWVNTVLGETWEEKGDSINVDVLAQRREVYPCEVPPGVGALIASVDVQGDRLEVAIKGYGVGEESWLVAFTTIIGDPGHTGVWMDLDAFLSQPWTTAGGRKVRIDCAVVDSGGLHTEMVYRYVRARLNAGVKIFAIKGGSITGAPLVARPTDSNRYRIKLFVLGVSSGKDMVMARLQIDNRGPGYVHLPDWADDEYLAQLTAERAIRKYVRGRGSVREWVKIRERNEAFDLEVYALAGLYIMGPALIKQLAARAKRWEQPPDAPAEEPTPPVAPNVGTGFVRTPARRRSWATRL